MSAEFFQGLRLWPSTGRLSSNLTLGQWFPTFDTFLPLLILELFIPPRLFGFVGYCNYNNWNNMVFIDDNNLINKSGTKTICCQIAYWH